MSEYEERLWNYQTAMAMARQMLSQGIITGKEYAKIDATIAKKYGVSSCSIFRTTAASTTPFTPMRV